MPQYHQTLRWSLTNRRKGKADVLLGTALVGRVQQVGSRWKGWLKDGTEVGSSTLQRHIGRRVAYAAAEQGSGVSAKERARHPSGTKKKVSRRKSWRGEASPGVDQTGAQKKGTQDRIGACIRFKHDEYKAEHGVKKVPKKKHKQFVAMCLSMERAGRLREDGSYIPVGRRAELCGREDHARPGNVCIKEKGHQPAHKHHAGSYGWSDDPADVEVEEALHILGTFKRSPGHADEARDLLATKLGVRLRGWNARLAKGKLSARDRKDITAALKQVENFPPSGRRDAVEDEYAAAHEALSRARSEAQQEWSRGYSGPWGRGYHVGVAVKAAEARLRRAERALRAQQDRRAGNRDVVGVLGAATTAVAASAPVGFGMGFGRYWGEKAAEKQDKGVGVFSRWFGKAKRGRGAEDSFWDNPKPKMPTHVGIVGRIDFLWDKAPPITKAQIRRPNGALAYVYARSASREAQLLRDYFDKPAYIEGLYRPDSDRIWVMTVRPGLHAVQGGRRAGLDLDQFDELGWEAEMDLGMSEAERFRLCDQLTDAQLYAAQALPRLTQGGSDPCSEARNALELFGGNKSKTAKHLGIARSVLYARLRRCGQAKKRR